MATLGADATLKAVYRTAYLNPFNGHSYKLIATTRTWAEARADCEAMGGYLVTVTSLEEKNFVTMVLSTQATPSFWYGAFQPQPEVAPSANWQWVTGEPWSYTNWNSGEPTNSAGNEHFLATVSTGGVWNDYPGTTLLGYICEWGWEDSYLPKSSYEGHRYSFIDLSMTWEQADDYAKQLGAKLASVNSAAESEFILSMIAGGTRS